MSNEVIILNGKTYEVISEMKWSLDKDYNILVGLKELPSSPPKEEFPKVFDGLLWKFHVYQDSSISCFHYDEEGKFNIKYGRPEDQEAYKKAVDCAEKIRGESK